MTTGPRYLDTTTWEEIPLDGADDWQTVIELSSGSYDWSELRVYWSPSARRYFWRCESGCSCDNPFEAASVIDYASGDRMMLIESVAGFARDYSLTAEDAITASRAIFTFKESS